MDERTESSALAEVVVGTDGTRVRAPRGRLGGDRGPASGRALRIVHVASYADTKAGILGRALTVAHQQDRHASVTTELLGGNPAEALVETARGADLLVVGMISEHAGDVLVARSRRPSWPRRCAR